MQIFFLLASLFSTLPTSAETVRLILEVRSEACVREATAQKTCEADSQNTNRSCAEENRAHRECYRQLPALFAPVLAPTGFYLDRNYAVDYTHVKQLHYMLKGHACDDSPARLENIRAALLRAGVEATLWVADRDNSACP